jgi:hypothetical protein
LLTAHSNVDRNPEVDGVHGAAPRAPRPESNVSCWVSGVSTLPSELSLPPQHPISGPGLAFSVQLLSTYCVPGTGLWKCVMDMSLSSWCLLLRVGLLTTGLMKPSGSPHFPGQGLEDSGGDGGDQIVIEVVSLHTECAKLWVGGLEVLPSQAVFSHHFSGPSGRVSHPQACPAPGADAAERQFPWQQPHFAEGLHSLSGLQVRLQLHWPLPEQCCPGAGPQGQR